ncbi:MAG: Calx-beta domain-containing protein [Pseudomonadota bacterium]
MNTISRLSSATVLTLFLAACGGGGGSDSADNGDTGGGGGTTTPSLSIADATLTEGDSATQDLEFTVTLSASATSDVTVDFTTLDGDADATDYTPTSGVLTISSGATSGVISVPIIGDTDIERDEGMSVELSNPVNATIGTGVGAGLIINNDFPFLTIQAATQPEGDSGTTAMMFTVSMDRPGLGEVTVDYAASDAAAVTGSDYTAATGALSIAEGDTLASFSINVNGDTDVEADEQFVVNLLNASANARIAVDEATGLILNDDFAKVSIGPAGVTETDSGTRAVSMPVSLDAVTPEDVTVSFVTSDGTALAGDDYTNRSDSITIPAGASSTSIAIDVIGDTAPEAAEFFLVTLSDVQGLATLDQAVAFATILDNDNGEVDPMLALQPAGVTEGDVGTTTMQFLFLLTEPLVDDVSFDVQTAGLTAVSGVDYEDVTTSITIAAGATSARVPVIVINDTEAEDDESFSLTVSNVPGVLTVPATTVIGTIADNDGTSQDESPRLSIGDAEAVEGDSGTAELTFSVILDTPATTPVSAQYVTEDGSALASVDYNAANGQITIPTGEVSTTIVISAIGDTFSEDDETFRVRLSDLSGDAEFARTSGIGTILTDEPLVRLSVADTANQEENDIDTEQRFTVSLDMPALNVVSFDYMTSDGTAVAGQDYVTTSGALQIPAGQSSIDIPVSILADTDNEPDETYLLTLTNVSTNAVVQDNVATGTIVNDDGTPGWQTPITLGGRFDYHSVAMHPDGNGAAVLIGPTDPSTFENPLLVARFFNGTWLDPEPTGGSLRIGFAQDPSITMLDNNRILAAWPSRTDVQSALYTTGGVWELLDISPEQGFYVDLDSNSAGDAILAFESNGNNSDPSDIYRDRFDGLSESWAGVELAELDETGSAREPQVVIDDTGNRLVYWFQSFSDSALTGNYFDYYDSATDSWSGPTRVAELDFARNEFLGLLRDGTPALITQITSGADDVVELWTFDDATLSWSTTGSIQSSAGEDAVLPKFAQAGDGMIFAAWFQEVQSAVYDVYVNRYDPATQLWETPVLLENVAGSANPLDTGLDIAADDAGNAIVVWSQNIAPSGQFDSRIRASRFSIDDGIWTPPEQIDDDDVNEAAIEPHIGMDRNGNAIVVWFYDGILEYGATHFIAP